VGSKSFTDRLTDGLTNARSRIVLGNYDRLRHPISLPARIRRKLSDSILYMLYSVGFVQKHLHSEIDTQVDSILRNKADWQKAYELLADDYSRRLLVDVVLFRLLGPRHVKLATNNPEYWNKQRLIKSYSCGTNLRDQDRRPSLVRYRFPMNEQLIEITCHPLHILNTFLLEQYACNRLDPPAVVRSGDIVIDGGACWGDSALYFAAKVGKQGRVYSFEFDSDNAVRLGQNIANNPKLAPNILLIERALWNVSDQAICSAASGPSARVDEHGSNSSTSTITIDDFVRQKNIDRLDFIKMDIEGAEYAALRGAEESLQKFRPKLAISAYHSLDDLHRLLLYLNRLDLGYAFALDHYTIHNEETVLFATAPKVMAKE
jgi:FkbM family methyltransferase